MVPVCVRVQKFQRKARAFAGKLVRVMRHHAAVDQKRFRRAQKQKKAYAAFVKNNGLFVDLPDVHGTPPRAHYTTFAANVHETRKNNGKNKAREPHDISYEIIDFSRLST